jgi:hypothetical protein
MAGLLPTLPPLANHPFVVLAVGIMLILVLMKNFNKTKLSRAGRLEAEWVTAGRTLHLNCAFTAASLGSRPLLSGHASAFGRGARIYATSRRSFF